MTINQINIKTPLGVMTACADQNSICLLEFIDQKNIDSHLQSLMQAYKIEEFIKHKNDRLEQLEHELNEYFAGTLKQFSVELNQIGTEFQKEVWRELTNIQYGETLSYSEQALRMGKPQSVRAIAGANSMNKIAIIIPCHRVIGKNGKLTGYAGGIDRKSDLLSLENRNK